MAGWSLLIFFPITFLIITIALVVAFLALQKRAAQSEDELRDDSLESGVAETLLKPEELSSISLWHSLLTRFDFVEIMKRQIAQSDLDWSVGRVTLSMLLSGTVALYILVRISWLPLWVATGGSWLIALLPYIFILRKRRKRFDKFREGFPDAVDSLTRGLRAGYPLLAALDAVASEAEPPVSAEFRKTFVEASLGMPLDRALANLSTRIPLEEVNLFVAAVQIHQRTGGRLSDVLARLTDTMREQLALSGEVRAIAAHGRVTGAILTAVPIGIAIMMLIVSPSYIKVLLEHPHGKDMIAAAVACLVLAHFVMRRLTDIKI